MTSGAILRGFDRVAADLKLLSPFFSQSVSLLRLHRWNVSILAIGLPNQSLAEVKGVPTSKRNLSLQDLLIQARHYSVPVKKGALVTRTRTVFDTDRLMTILGIL